MTTGNKTLYEVLGVRQNAKQTDIGLAYQRLKAEMRKETVAPDARLAAQAKFAHDTLTDPGRRAEYDKTLVFGMKPPRRGKRGKLVTMVVFAVIAAAGAAYYFLLDRPAPKLAERPAEKSLGAREVLDAVKPYLGRVQGALMSGELRDLGTAVAIGQDEMATTCRGIAPGMLFTVKAGETTTKAELARENEDLDICVLAVKGAAAGIKMRPGMPASKETLHAIVLNAAGAAEARPVSVAKRIEDPKGPAVELKAAAPLANGTPVFDSQARLIGIVTTPHAFGEGVVAALGASRIALARGAVAPPAAAAPAAVGSSPAEAAAPPPEPAGQRGPSGTKVAEGFTTLWKEGEGGLTEVLDSVKKGDIGIPLAYWTRWTGRNSGVPQVVTCVVTYGPEEEVVADYEQDNVAFDADGYWFCALTRFQVNLDDLPKGDYTFRIIVNGTEMAQSSIRIERRFFTRGVWAFLVLAAGLGLLAFFRRRKAEAV